MINTTWKERHYPNTFLDKKSQDTITLLVSRTDDLIPDGDRKMYLLRREIKQAWNWPKSPHAKHLTSQKNCRTFIKLNVPQKSINPKKTITLLDKCWRLYVGQLNFTGIQFSFMFAVGRFSFKLWTRNSLSFIEVLKRVQYSPVQTSSTLAPSSHWAVHLIRCHATKWSNRETRTVLLSLHVFISTCFVHVNPLTIDTWKDALFFQPENCPCSEDHVGHGIVNQTNRIPVILLTNN